jgi:site-specific recombinase XerD
MSALVQPASEILAGRHLTLRQLARGWGRWLEAHNHPATTIAAYGDAVGRFLTFAARHGIERPDAVTVLFLDSFYRWLQQQGAAPATIAHRRSVLISFFRWLEHEDLADRNIPAKTYPIKTPRRVPVYLEPHAIDAWLARLATLPDLLGRRDHAMIATFFYAGPRVAELAALQLADVDLAGARMRITEGKGGKGRMLYIAPRLAPILRAYIEGTRPALLARPIGYIARPHSRDRAWWAMTWADGRRVGHRAPTEGEAHALLQALAPPLASSWLFVNAGLAHRGKLAARPLLTRSIHAMVQRRARTMLHVSLSPHALRHTCASYLLYNGASPETVQRLLGHADVHTTLSVYVHVPQKRQEEEIGRIFGNVKEGT